MKGDSHEPKHIQNLIRLNKYKKEELRDRAKKEECIYLGSCTRDFAIGQDIYHVLKHKEKLYVVSKSKINAKFSAMDDLNRKLTELLGESYYSLSQSDQDNLVSINGAKQKRS